MKMDAGLAANLALDPTLCTAAIERPECAMLFWCNGWSTDLKRVARPHSVSLSWTASTSSNVKGYNVYRGTTSGDYTVINSSIVAGTTYTDGTVEAGKTYFYVARAVDTNNVESAYSIRPLPSYRIRSSYV